MDPNERDQQVLIQLSHLNRNLNQINKTLEKINRQIEFNSSLKIKSNVNKQAINQGTQTLPFPEVISN